MAATIDDLLIGKPDLVTTRIDANVKDILAEMIKYDYSQLPVVDDDQRPIGLITSDSIARALHNFNVKTDGLCVRDAMIRTPATYYPSDDVFDLLDDLEIDEVVFIINEGGHLIGIITTYDTTRYLRQRAEDIMVVREVEEMIKSYTNAAFTNPSGDIDAPKQKSAIAEITPTNASLKGKFRKALEAYLTDAGDAKPRIDATVLDKAFTSHLYEKPSTKPFDKLSLGEYINLFLHQSRWPTYSTVFSIDREAIRHLLDSVRQTRNALAHFRDDISPQQREGLRFCREWLARHEKAINTAFGAINGAAVSSGANILSPSENGTPTSNPDTPHATTPITTVQPTNGNPVQTTAPVVSDEDATGPLDEPPITQAGRYTPLIRYLVDQPAQIGKVTLTFNQIDEVLGEHRLPESARKFRAWWANDTVSHSQSQQWLEAGWRVANITMAEERVTFARNSEHEKAYIHFFSQLQAELEQAAPGSYQFTIPSETQYWIGIGSVRTSTKALAWFYCSFTRTKRFRIELYIDTQDQLTTKQLYDLLYERKEIIEAEVGDKLSWERLDANRPSRIARYYPGSITDTTGSLANLRARAVEAAKRFVPVLRRHLVTVMPDVLGTPAVEAVTEVKR